jgi:hypothetical protein
VQWPGTSESEECETAGIVSSLQRNHLDGAGHVLVGNLDDGRGEVDRAHAGPAGQVSQSDFGQIRVETHPAAQEILWIEPAEKQIGVGDGRSRAT